MWENSPQKPLLATQKCFFSSAIATNKTHIFHKTLSPPDFSTTWGWFHSSQLAQNHRVHRRSFSAGLVRLPAWCDWWLMVFYVIILLQTPLQSSVYSSTLFLPSLCCLHLSTRPCPGIAHLPLRSFKYSRPVHLLQSNSEFFVLLYYHTPKWSTYDRVVSSSMCVVSNYYY